MDINQIMENWGEAKEVLLDGLKSDKRSIVAPLLENQRDYIMKESAAAGAVQAHDIANFRKTLLPMIRRIIPGTIASEIVGVQPMSGPVSLVYTLRYKYAESMDHDPDRSPFGGFDIERDDEAFGNEKLLRQFYSGSTGADQFPGASGIANPNAAEADIDRETGEGTAWPSERDARTYEEGEVNFGDVYGYPVGGSLFGGSGSFLEGSGGRKMTLEIVNQAVEAGTRKLQAGWTIEAMQDMNSQHGLDVESELTKALSAEIVQEIDAEIITDLLGLAGTVRTFDFSQTGGATYAPAFVGDRFANLGVRINEVANEIARKTRRGAGNFIVVSPMIVSVLQSAAKAVFAPAVEGSFKGPNNTQLAGTLNGSIKVYSYLWNNAVSANAQVPSGYLGQEAGNDQILVGFKGGNGETDCGYWYTPYIPLMSSGVIVHPVTFQPVMSLMTRYGKVALTDQRTSLGNSADYYGKVNVTNLDFI